MAHKKESPLPTSQPHIGTLQEKSLHAALKAWAQQPGDACEVRVDGYVIDLVRDDTLIEIQTGNFTALKRKFGALLPHYPIRLLYPIPQEKWIVRETAVGDPISRRKSPKRGQLLDSFSELVRIPHLLTHPNLTVELLLTQQEEVWRDDGQGSWRRKGWSVADHRLLDVVTVHRFQQAGDWLTLLPAALSTPFTTADLAKAAKIRRHLAQRVAYTLRRADLLAQVGKQGNAHLYAALE